MEKDMQFSRTALLIGEEGVKDIYHEYIPFKHAFDREICHAKYRAPFDPEF